MNYQISPLGVVIAAAFAIAMGSLLWWMLKLPPYIPAAAAKARRGVGALRNILVPTVGLPCSERGIEMACRLGQEQKATIHLIYVIEVSRTLPLDAPMPEIEPIAKDALKRAEEIVTLRGLTPVSEIRRARIAGEEIIRVAKDIEAQIIVMGIRTSISMTEHIIGRTSEIVMRRAPCEVLIDKLPGE